MAWDVVLFGSLSVPRPEVEPWLAEPARAELYPWLEELGGAEVVPETPETLVEFLRDVTVAPHEIFEVTLADGHVTVECYVSEDPYRQTSLALGLLFASAAPFGGTGELTFLGYQGIRFAERLVVARGRAHFTPLSQEQRAEVERSDAFLTLDRRIHRRFDELVGREPVEEAGPGARYIIHPFTGRRVKVAAPAAPLT